MLAPGIVEVLAGFIVVWLAVRMRQGRVARGSAPGSDTVHDAQRCSLRNGQQGCCALGGASAAVLSVGCPRRGPA